MVLFCHARYPLFVHVCTQLGVYIYYEGRDRHRLGLIWQGRQRCRMEMPLDLTWARERILQIIQALGSKAKLSIFRKFYSGRYCVTPSSHIKITSGSRGMGM